MILRQCFSRSSSTLSWTRHPATMTMCRLLSSSSSSSSSKPFARVLVVGSGRMGAIRTKAINANPKFELCGVVDSSFDGAVALADTYRVSPYSSLQGAVEAQGQEKPLDGLVVCTPTYTHSSVVREAANHKLDVFMEKPVDETAEDIKVLFQFAADANIQICCGFQRRFDPSYQEATQAVREGAVGNPTMSNIFFADHPIPPKKFLLTGGNIFMDLASHDVDYIMHTLDDEVVSVYATGSSSDEELAAAGVHDNATMVMNFKKGTVVTLFMSRSASYGYDQRCEIFGSEGLISVENVHENATVISNTLGIHQARLKHSFPQRFHTAFGLELDAFADTLIANKAWPVTADQCIRVQRVVDAARQSAELGQVVSLTTS